jgi:hypothetical protein
MTTGTAGATVRTQAFAESRRERAAGHHTCRHLRDVHYGEYRGWSIVPGGT